MFIFQIIINKTWIFNLLLNKTNNLNCQINYKNELFLFKYYIIIKNNKLILIIFLIQNLYLELNKIIIFKIYLQN